MKVFFLISFLFCFFGLSALGNGSPYLDNELTPTKIDKTEWETITEGLDYGEIKKRAIKKPVKKFENLDFFVTLLKIIGVLSVVAIIVFLLRYFVGLQGVQSATNKSFDPNEKIDTQTIAEHIHEHDLNTLIQQAIAQKEYPTAIRLYYLLVIKTLSDKQLIKWKKDKTNRNYLNELVAVDTKNNFRELTNIFERIWYGDVTINENIFKNIVQVFEGFIEKMSK